MEKKIYEDGELIDSRQLGTLTVQTYKFNEPNNVFEIEDVIDKNGGYVGDVEFAKMLIKRGIEPELAKIGDKTCSIGFCKKEQKWYGWSHRAIYGFGIGYRAKKGDCCTKWGVIEEYQTPENDFRVPVGFECKTLEDCKKCAIAFAESVS